MKKIIYHLTFVLLFCIPFVTLGQEGHPIKELSAVEFMEMILEENHHILIDVSSPEYFKKKRIEGAINAPDSETLNSILDTLDVDRPVLIYCQHGIRSFQVGKLIKTNQEFQLYGLKGGLTSWKETGYSIDRKKH